MLYGVFTYEIRPQDIPPYDVKGLRDMHSVMKDVKRAYKRRKQSDLAHSEFLRVSLGVIRSLNRDVTNSEITVDEKTIRSFFNEGLLEFTMEAIHEPGFFDESQAPTSTMLLGLLSCSSCLVDELEVVDLSERLVNRLTPEFWEYVWGFRHITLAHPLRHVFKTMTHLIGSYVRMCALLGDDRVNKAVQTRIVQWTFFAWLKLTSESSQDCALTGRDALRLWGIFYESREVVPPQNDFFKAKSQFYVDILAIYGAEEIINRIAYDCADVEAQAYGRKAGNRYYEASISKLLYNLGDFPETSDFVVSSGLLTQLILRVERYDDHQIFHQNYGNAIVVFTDVLKNFAMAGDASYILLPEDFARYLAHGVNVYALEFYDSEKQRKTHMQRVMTLFRYLEAFNTTGDEAGYIHYMDAIYDLSDIFVYAINQNLHSYLHKNGSKFLEEEAPPISTRWLGLFYRLHCMAGLDPSYSKIEYDNHREQICDWQRCRHSWEPATDKKLKLCRGCGVARYCGSDCQRSDWKEGRHKEMCGKRIKDH